MSITLAARASVVALAVALASQSPVLASDRDVAEAPGDTANAEAEQQPETVIIVSARRREESSQDVPIALSVVDVTTLDNTGSFNVSRLTQLQPSLQFYSSNPRNSAINIRGLGAPFGLTNDGIEQGVGIYIDDVFVGRVAVATLDFLDIAQVETLRGPQGTLYGKNTTAGAINITSKEPSFDFEGRAEVTAGNLEFRQAKASVSGPLSNTLAVRFGVATTDRRGTIFNVATGTHVNELNNLGLRGSLLWKPSDSLRVTLAGDYNRQNPECCAQIYARYGSTQRPANRQFPALSAAFGYAPPSLDAFDRVTDVDAELSARSILGGASLKIEWDVGPGTLTSVSAWRFWDWTPSNDRDFTGLPITLKVNNPSQQEQFTQEVRYAGSLGDRIDFVAGVFGFYQTIDTQGIQEQGTAASRWLLAPTSALAGNPAVLNGLVANNTIGFKNTSVAAFGQLSWKVTDDLTIQPGVRINYDKKTGSYDSVVTGTASNGTRQLVSFNGPFANDPWIVAQRGVLAPQFFEPEFSDWNLSYEMTLSYRIAPDIRAYATYARTFKTGGINLSGVPNDAAGNPLLAAGSVKPEKVDHFEVGLKTQFWDRRATLNLAGFWTEIRDYQATVNNGQLGVLRGYLANAGKVRVRGIEADFSVRPSDRFNVYVSGAYTDHEYVRFVDAPCPPELAGGTTVTGTQVPGAPGVPGALSPANCDISGQWLPGISNWAFSYGFEYNEPVSIFGLDGFAYAGFDGNYRSKFSSNPSRSIYTDISGYALSNFRLGYRTDDGLNLFAWVRNAFDVDYFEQLAANTGGNTGLIAGQPGDPRTYGLTIASSF